MRWLQAQSHLTDGFDSFDVAVSLMDLAQVPFMHSSVAYSVPYIRFHHVHFYTCMDLGQVQLRRGELGMREGEWRGSAGVRLRVTPRAQPPRAAPLDDTEQGRQSTTQKATATRRPSRSAERVLGQPPLKTMRYASSGGHPVRCAEPKREPTGEPARARKRQRTTPSATTVDGCQAAAAAASRAAHVSLVAPGTGGAATSVPSPTSPIAEELLSAFLGREEAADAPPGRKAASAVMHAARAVAALRIHVSASDPLTLQAGSALQGAVRLLVRARLEELRAQQ